MGPYVVGRAFTPLIEEAQRLDLDGEALTAGLTYSHDELLRAPFRLVPWDDFARYSRRIEAELGPDFFDQLGPKLLETKGYSPFYKMSGLLIDARWMFRFTNQVFGPLTFPAVESEYTELDKNSSVLEMHIPEELEDCPQFFRGCASAFRILPVAFGMESALVDMNLRPRHATFHVRYPPSPSLLTRVRRSARGFFAPNFVADEFVSQHRELYQRFEEYQLTASSLRSFFEHSPQGVLLVRKNEIHFANQAFCAFLDYPDSAELIGRPLEKVSPEPAMLLERGLSKHKARHIEQFVFQSRGGEPVPCEVTAFEAYFEGQPVSVFLARDARLKNQILSQAMEMDRIIAMGTVAAGVAHEINNPLAYVLTNLDFLAAELESIKDHPEYKELIKAVQDSTEGVERIQTITRDLQDFSRAPQDRVRSVELDQVLEQGLKMAHHEVKYRAVVEVDLQVRRLTTDPHRLGQVLLNLLLNALQAIEPGARDKNRIAIRATKQEDQVKIELQDTGGGIAEEVLPHIFEPFYTTRREQGGTGIGLFISRAIVRRLGGELTLESEVDRGTTATITLPLEAKVA